MQELIQRVVDLPRTRTDIVKHRSFGSPLLIDFRHPFDGCKGFCKGSPEHPSAATNIGLLDRIIDIGDDTHATFLGQKNGACNWANAVVPSDRALLLGL